jgi:Holliday junction DNA helicase RuvA
VIARLSGTVLEKQPNRVVVDVAGVGYDVQVPLSTFYGVGEPGAAITLRVHTHVVLSGIDPGELVRAIRTQDVARLTRIPGVGKKTAERIGLELKDRLPHAAAGGAFETIEPGSALRDDLLSALANLGYQRGAVEKAVDAVLDKTPDAPFEHALRDVLRGMMK